MSVTLLGWSTRAWAIAIPWARRLGIVSDGAITLDEAIKVHAARTERGLGSPEEVILVGTPEPETDYGAAFALIRSIPADRLVA